MVIRTLLRLLLAQRGAASDQLVQRLSEAPVIRSAARATAALFLKSRGALTDSSAAIPKTLTDKVTHVLEKWTKQR